LHDEEDTADVDRHQAVVLRRLDLLERARECDARARDDGAERALGIRSRDDCAHPLDVGDVELRRARGEPFGSQAFGALPGVHPVEVGDDDVVAACRERLRNRAADALRAADDEGAARRVSGCSWHR
jgi:hypothetical protein